VLLFQPYFPITPTVEMGIEQCADKQSYETNGCAGKRSDKRGSSA
jgi:hypothetical protein